MKYLILLFSLLVGGCATNAVPIAPKFPDPYVINDKKEMPKCGKLKEQTGDNVPITELLKTVVQNYGMYYKCSDYVDGWNTWYIEQKKIYEQVKK